MELPVNSGVVEGSDTVLPLSAVVIDDVEKLSQNTMACDDQGRPGEQGQIANWLTSV